MKTRILNILILLLAMLPIDSYAYKKYVTNNLHLRYEANAHSYILTVIPKGTAVTIDEDCDCKWVPVEYNGYVGYISTRYLSSRPVNTRRTTRQISYSSRHSSSARRTSSPRYYTNTYGERVQSPTYYSSTPSGATALCNDGSYSFSRSRRGTCSHHGGVSQWLR